jgi:uncharacterized integral membrane protein
VYRIGFILITVLAIALGLLIGTLNSDTVTVDLLWVELNWPIGLLILSALAAGFLIGLALTWVFSILPLRAQLRKSRGADSHGASNSLKTPHG